LKFGVVAVAAQATHVVTVVRLLLAVRVAVMLLKQLVHHQDVNIAYAQVAHGHVARLTVVQQVWDVKVM
jgi:hypothetical protein